MSTGGDFWGARPIEVKSMRALTPSARINAVRGTTITVITRPANRRFFVFQILVAGFTLKAGNHPQLLFADADIDLGADTITETAHGLASGTGPWQAVNSGGALPTGIDLLTDYFVGVVDDDTFTLHTNHTDAVKDLARVDITAAAGGGTHILGTMPTGGPAATNEDGQEASFYSAANTDGRLQVIAAPTEISVNGDGSTSNLIYWWLP